MARKLERAQVSLLRKVVSEDWELWNFAPGRPTLTAKRFARAEDVPIRVTVALPLQQTLCLAQWVPTTDLEVARDVLQLNLEQRGLLASSSPSDLSVRMIEKSDSEALFRAALLRPDFPSELTFVHAERFEPLADTLVLGTNRIYLWRDDDRSAVIITRGIEPVFFQRLSRAEVDPPVLAELQCIRLQLAAQRVIKDLQAVVLWGAFSHDEINLIGKRMSLPVMGETVPKPIFPATPSNLLPPAVASLHAKRRRQRQVRRLIGALMGAYAAAVLAFMGYIWWQRNQAEELQKRLREEAPTVAAIQSAAEQWRNLQWAVDPRVYPVEVLHQVATLLPPQGLRLTALELEQGKVFVRGEATGAPAAFKLAEDIKANPELQLFTWQMRSPSLRPDGRAEFVIEGSPKLAKTN
jgi:hypothetical protein